MAKKLLFLLLLCKINIFPHSIFANTEPLIIQKTSIASETCTLPPPDSFRITSVSSNYISLAWNPTWVGALYDLSIFEKNNSGGWTASTIVTNISGTSFAAENLIAGKEYRFKIASKCSTSDPSELTSFIDGITLIVELTTAGKTPLNPAQVNCLGIAYKNPAYKWVGFRVSHYGEGGLISNLFEFEETESPGSGNNYYSKIKIKRVITDPIIVAADQIGEWPDPIVKSNPFYMLDNSNEGNPIDIGTIQVTRNLTFPPTIDLCQISSIPPWNDFYTFEALVAFKVSSSLSPTESENRIKSTPDITSTLQVQNPFKEALNITMSQPELNKRPFILYLLNTSGQVVLKTQLRESLDSYSVPVGSIPSGMYFLHIKTDYDVYTLKVCKSE